MGPDYNRSLRDTPDTFPEGFHAGGSAKVVRTFDSYDASAGSCAVHDPKGPRDTRVFNPYDMEE